MEEFRPIEGYENYLVSNMGRVYSKRSDKILKPGVSGGYFMLNLCKNNKRKTCSVHRLVGLAFIPKVAGKDMIDHIDRNKQNNKLSNLRWVNYTENNRNTICFRTDIPSDLARKERHRLSREIDGKKALEEKKFYCEVCDYNTIRNTSLQIHLKTKKHLSKIQQL